MTMETGFKNIVLGLILATFHITLDTLQIVPSFVGWILVAMGVNSIAKAEGNELFTKAKNISVVLILLTLLDLIKINLVITIRSPYMLSTLMALMELFFIYYFFCGITEMLKRKGKIKQACENVKMLSGYTILHIIGILIMCICWLTSSSLTGALIGIYMVALRIYIIYRVNKIGKDVNK